MKGVVATLLSICAVLVLLLAGCGQSAQTPLDPPEDPSKAPPGNSFSGYVYQSDGKTPIAGASVYVWQSRSPKELALTDADGWYMATGLPAGEYAPIAGAPGYRSECYGGTDPSSIQPEDRLKVMVSDDSATTNVDFRMKALASISGRVHRAEDGEPIPGARILVYGEHWSTGPILATTAADGSYRVTGLNAGESTVAVEAEGYVTTRYDGVYSSDDATKVATTYGNDTPNIGFALEWGGSISGHVYQPDGVTPAAEVGIRFKQVSGVETPRLGGCEETAPYDAVRSSADGSYTIGGLLTGEYELVVIARDTNLFSNGTTVAAAVLGEETQDIDFVLVPGGSVSGHVYESDGSTPEAGIWVVAYDWLGGHSTVAASDGSYSIEQLMPGDCLVGASNRSAYVTVTVTSGEKTVHDIVQVR